MDDRKITDKQIEWLLNTITERIITSTKGYKKLPKLFKLRPKNKVDFLIFATLFESWIVSVAIKQIKPPFWKEILVKIYMKVGSNLSGIKEEEFIFLTQKHYPEFSYAMTDPQCLELGKMMHKLLFGQDNFDLFIVTYLERLARAKIRIHKKFIKDVFEIFQS